MGAKVAASTVLAGALLDPFVFFQPTVRLVPGERLTDGRPFARTFPAPSGSVGIVASVPIDIDGQRLVTWMHDIAALKRSKMVLQIGTFSATPSLPDVQGLTLDDEDIAEVMRCRPQGCGIKLTVGEIAHLRDAIGTGPPHSTPAVQQAFREIVVARAQAFLKVGRRDTPPPAFLSASWPSIARAVLDFPKATPATADAFLYWDKNAFGGKPLISLTHVTIVHGAGGTEPEVLVIGQQVFATHYTDAAWSFTALMHAGSTRHLVYLNQSQIDLLDSWYAGLVRRVVERRLRDEAVEVLDGLRRRLESGDPPARAGA